MYGYCIYTPINTEEILKRIRQEDIFKIVFEDIDLNKKYTAPYRDDKEAGCWFHYYEDVLYFTDFASNPINLTCFGLLQKVFNKSFKEVLELINSHFKLGLGNSTSQPKQVKFEPIKIKKQIVKKQIKNILAYIRPFEQRDIKYWSQYGITIEQLKSDKVYAISNFKAINKEGKTFLSSTPDIAYAYTDFENNKLKIYRPNKKEFKWFTNLNQNDVGNVNSVKCVDYIIITKSYKDCRVLRNLGYNSIWFQNEGQFPNKIILNSLLYSFNSIYIWFDNDTTGMSMSNVLKETIKNIFPDKTIKIILIPPILFRNQGIKDPSDYYKTLGKEKLKEFIKNIINF